MPVTKIRKKCKFYSVTFTPLSLDWSSVMEYSSSFIYLNLQTCTSDMCYFKAALFSMWLLLEILLSLTYCNLMIKWYVLMGNWCPNGQICSPLPSLPFVLDKFSSHLLCAGTDAWQVCSVELKPQKIITFLAELDFCSFISTNYFTVWSQEWQCWCKGSKM